MTATQTITFYIDGEPYSTAKPRLTGAQLRALTTPPTETLWHDIPDAQDVLVTEHERISIHEGARFFTDRPRTIYIDGVAYTVNQSAFSTDALRAIANPPVAADHLLWRDVPDKIDQKLNEGSTVRVVQGDRFFSKAPKRIEVTFNNQVIEMLKGEHNGTQIKQFAIEAGIQIQADFQLAVKVEDRFRNIGDHDIVKVRKHDEFTAVAGDDNS